MPRLYLVPNSISEAEDHHQPTDVTSRIKDVRTYFVEEPKSARRLLKRLHSNFPLQDCRFFELNEHSRPQDLVLYAKIIQEGDCAVISEAGVPCVADPGADLVWLAHQNRVDVVPLPGASSILLGLMACGFSGQNFAFNGYLPRQPEARKQKIKALETRLVHEGQTQMFMEAPYRNQALFNDVLASCHDRTCLCIAIDMMGETQQIRTMSIKDWKKASLVFGKKPALFLLGLPAC